MSDEVWLDIPGLEDTHQLSSLRRVRIKRQVTRPNGRRRIKPAKIIDASALAATGFRYSPDGTSDLIAFDVLSLMHKLFGAALRTPTRKLVEEREICRFCGDWNCQLHKPKSRNAGENSGHAKLTEKDVRWILFCNMPDKEAAERYDVTETTIRAIRERKTWRHLKINF